MGVKVRVGVEIVVDTATEASPRSPDRASAALLLGLLASGDKWIERAEIAKRLYSDAPFFRLERHSPGVL